MGQQLAQKWCSVPCGWRRGCRSLRLRAQLCFDRGKAFQYWRTKLEQACVDCSRHKYPVGTTVTVSRLAPVPGLRGGKQELAAGLFSIRAVVVKRFQANNSNFCRSRARASLRDQPLALPAWDQQEETEQSDSRTDRGRAIDTRVQSELVSSIVPRGTSLRWIVAPTVWRSSLRLSAPFPLSSGTRFHHSTCDA